MESARLDRVTIAAFIASVFFGGMNAIGVRFTVQELSPFWGATIRFAPASLLLFLIVLIKRLPFPTGRSLLGAILFGVFNFGSSYSFLYYGLQKVHAGMAQVFLALGPLLTLLFAIAHRQEKFRWRAFLGALLAIGGIAIVFGEEVNAHVPLSSLIAIIMGAVCMSEGGVIAKSFPKSHPVTTNAIAMGVGAIMLFALSRAFQEPMALPQKAVTWASILYLILFGSCLVFILMLVILKRWTASATSYIFVLMPFVTLTASAEITHEAISPILLVGGVLVLIGVYFGAIASPRKKRQPLPSESGA